MTLISDLWTKVVKKRKRSRQRPCPARIRLVDPDTLQGYETTCRYQTHYGDHTALIAWPQRQVDLSATLHNIHDFYIPEEDDDD